MFTGISGSKTVLMASTIAGFNSSVFVGDPARGAAAFGRGRRRVGRRLWNHG